MRLAAPFDELATWIAENWGVAVINVIYDRRTDLHAPRLQVIFEQYDDARSFHDGCNFDKTKQEAIASRFIEIVSRHPNHEYDLDGLFVVFSAFAPLAMEEADSKITKREIDSLKRRIGNPDLWEISRCFGHVTFMFYTDAQVEEYAAQGKKKEYARKYFELLKPHDEFGYLSEDDFAVHFDSKQNFDDNYKSNWFYYCR